MFWDNQSELMSDPDHIESKIKEIQKLEQTENLVAEEPDMPLLSKQELSQFLFYIGDTTVAIGTDVRGRKLNFN